VPSDDVDGLPCANISRGLMTSLLKNMNYPNKKVSKTLSFDHLELFPMNDLPLT
jgi:hypothetical protein